MTKETAWRACIDHEGARVTVATMRATTEDEARRRIETALSLHRECAKLLALWKEQGRPCEPAAQLALKG